MLRGFRSTKRGGHACRRCEGWRRRFWRGRKVRLAGFIRRLILQKHRASSQRHGGSRPTNHCLWNLRNVRLLTERNRARQQSLSQTRNAFFNRAFLNHVFCKRAQTTPAAVKSLQTVNALCCGFDCGLRDGVEVTTGADASGAGGVSRPLCLLRKLLCLAVGRPRRFYAHSSADNAEPACVHCGACGGTGKAASDNPANEERCHCAERFNA